MSKVTDYAKLEAMYDKLYENRKQMLSDILDVIDDMTMVSSDKVNAIAKILYSVSSRRED